WAPDDRRRAAGVAAAVDAAGHRDRQRAEVGDELGGAGEALDVEDEGRQHGRRDGADAGDGGQVVGRRQGVVGVGQQLFQAFLAGGGGAGVGGPGPGGFLGGPAGARGGGGVGGVPPA